MTKPVRKGFLTRYKKRIIGSNWREEWVVLHEDSTLEWYKDHDEADFLGGIMLKEAPEMIAAGPFACYVPDRPELPKKADPNNLMVFGTKTKDRTFWFLAKNMDDLNFLRLLTRRNHPMKANRRKGNRLLIRRQLLLSHHPQDTNVINNINITNDNDNNAAANVQPSADHPDAGDANLAPEAVEPDIDPEPDAEMNPDEIDPGLLEEGGYEEMGGYDMGGMDEMDGYDGMDEMDGGFDMGGMDMGGFDMGGFDF